MTLTPQIFSAFLRCPTKCWLLAASEPPSGNTFGEWVKSKNESYRIAAVEKLGANTIKGEVSHSPTMENLKAAANWRFAFDIVAQAQLDSCLLESRLPAVERIPAKGRGRPDQFMPVRFEFRNKLGRAEKQVVAFDALILSKNLGHEVDLGKIIYGDKGAAVTVKTSALVDEVRKRVGQIARLVSNAAPPDLVLNRHCAECEFQARCRKIAVEKDDLSLLAGMGEKERQNLRSKGIFTVTQLSYTFRPRRRPRRLHNKHEKYHQSLKALAIREKKIHIVGCPELKIEGTPVYLDVEGLPHRDFYYLIGARVGGGSSAVQHSLWADTAEDERKIWRALLGLLATITNPVVVHYGSYETSFLKCLVQRYGGPQEGTSVARAFESAKNLVPALFGKVYFPTYSNSLKEIARYLGYEWSDPDASGTSSIVWRIDWERSRLELLKRKLVAYNAEDCIALAQLHERLASFASAGYNANDSAGVINADLLPRSGPCTFKQNVFQLPEFEQINQAAYWDYQRERVLIRSSERLRRVGRRKTAKMRLVTRPNQTVDWPAPSMCPKCGSHTLYRHRPATKIVFDIRFGYGAIKRWVTRFRFGYFRCATCRAVFQDCKRGWDGHKFGPNIRAFSNYLTISLRMPLHQATSFLNSTFRLQLSVAMVSIFKEGTASFYKSTCDALLQSMIGGHLVQVDETRIYLGKQAGYVWVFTNLEKVVYLYSNSREGEMIQDLLKEFNGVVVSDFYAAYDSLKCAQQKCLIHLIRDLNDGLFKEPFNEEYKDLVKELGALLKPMIETVDRFGLKARFLRKHKAEVNRFFRHLTRRTYESELASKCQRRLQKNREVLFTFLDHDDVPWNNNNAEHAVKAFAQLRRNFEGLSTEKGITEYLILLSVCETCRCVGVDFLEFLLSGEKDIHAFAEHRQEHCRPGSLAANRQPAKQPTPTRLE